MQHDLEKSYILSCQDYQWNKSWITKAPGPLHPLPVPDGHGTSVATDFVGPLKPDNGFDCILTITDCLNADIHMVPTHIDINADDLAHAIFQPLILQKWFAYGDCIQ